MGKSAMGSLSFNVAANALLILDDEEDEKMGGDKKAAADAMPAPPSRTFRRWPSFFSSDPSPALPVDCSDSDRQSCLEIPVHLSRW
jgi:hypothetical protein